MGCFKDSSWAVRDAACSGEMSLWFHFYINRFASCMSLENSLGACYGAWKTYCWILAWSSLTHQCDLRDQGAERVHMLAYPREPVYIMLKCFLFVECAALGKAITGFAQEVRCFLPALFDLLFAHLADSIHFPMSSKYHDLCDTVYFLDWNHNACIDEKHVT
jgi:hypothetical protein